MNAKVIDLLKELHGGEVDEGWSSGDEVQMNDIEESEKDALLNFKKMSIAADLNEPEKQKEVESEIEKEKGEEGVKCSKEKEKSEEKRSEMLEGEMKERMYGMGRMLTYSPSDSIKLVIEKILASPDKRLIHMKKRNVEGIISFTDVLHFILKRIQ
jgi:hypothetical protein